MPKWFNLQIGKKQQKPKQSGESIIYISPVLSWFRSQLGKTNKKIGLAKKEEPIKEHPQIVQSARRISPLETVIDDKKQLTDSTQLRTPQEAETEAARIIARAKIEAQEIKSKAEIDAQKRAEEIITAANRRAEITELEVKHKAIQFFTSVGEEVEKQIKEEYQKAYSRLSSSLKNLMMEGQDIEGELKGRVAKLLESKSFELKEYEAKLLGAAEVNSPPSEAIASTSVPLKDDITNHEKVESPAVLEKEVIVEKVEEPASVQKEVIAEKIEEPAVSKLDSQAIYTGEVELLIASPVELQLMAKLFNYLQTVPELKILSTRGSWDQGTTITVVPDKPMPILDIISKTPDVAITAETLEKDELPLGRGSTILRSDKRRAKRIKLFLKQP